ncbi:MAG: hypothetical protein HQM12_19535 [SAR324 cluster bacterium]|nr:hypothetical protein [SAR324 cluster bacterium]
MIDMILHALNLMFMKPGIEERIKNKEWTMYDTKSLAFLMALLWAIMGIVSLFQ